MKCLSSSSNNPPPETLWLLTCSRNTCVMYFVWAWSFCIALAQLSVIWSWFELTSRFATLQQSSRRPALPVKMWINSLSLRRTFYWIDAQMFVFFPSASVPTPFQSSQLPFTKLVNWLEQRGVMGFASSLRPSWMWIHLWLCSCNKVTF